MRTLLLVGNQPDNLGDVILNKNLIEVFRENGEVVVDDHYLDGSYTSELDLESGEVSLLSTRGLPNPRRLGGMLALIFAGTRPYDIISRYPGHYTPSASLKTLLRELIMAVIYTLFKLRGYRVVLVGITMTTDNLRGPRLLLERWQASMHALYSVRDKTVYQELKDLGVKQVKHVPDIFLLATPENLPPSTLEPKGEGPSRIVIGLRPDVHESKDPKRTREQNALRVRELLDSLPQTCEVIFSFQVARDHGYNQSLYEACRDRPNTLFLTECRTVESARELYLSCDVVLSNRLHCLLYCTTLGVPMIAFTDWPGHKKIYGAWKDFELSEYHYNIFDPIDVCRAKIDDLTNNRESHREALYGKARAIKETVAQRIMEVL